MSRSRGISRWATSAWWARTLGDVVEAGDDQGLVAAAAPGGSASRLAVQRSAPPPSTAWYVSPRIGASTTPTTVSPSRSAAMETAQVGSP